jgi:hypothetical protein
MERAVLERVPRDLESTVVFLVGDSGSFIDEETLVVDGVSNWR